MCSARAPFALAHPSRQRAAGGWSGRRWRGGRFEPYIEQAFSRAAVSQVVSSLDSSTIRRVVEAVVREVRPLRVVLFGSQARGDAHADSDLDLLVVIPDDQRPLDVMKHLARHVRGFGIPLDFVAVRDADLRRYGDSPGMIYQNALASGVELHVSE